MKIISKIITILFVAITIVSCKKESLQSYLVESQEKEGFTTIDLPVSFLQLKTDDASEDVKKTLKSIRKINVVILPFNDNREAYKKEKATLKSIFKNSKKYKSLMRFKKNGVKLNLYYTGNEDAIDEVIAFGYGDDKGVGVARVLGNNMNPSKIMKMMKDIKFDTKNLKLKQFKTIFSKKE